MSVRDERRSLFARADLDALKLIHDRLPPRSQAGARNAYLTLCEASAMARDFAKREGHTLRKLSDLGGMSDRRLRDHLHDLEDVGLVRIEAHEDPVGRPLATTYVLVSGPDGSSGYRDGTRSGGMTNRPGLRAGAKGEREETEEPPAPQTGSVCLPAAPAGNRQRDAQRDVDALTSLAADWYPTANRALAVSWLRGARGDGCETRTEVDTYLARWCPQLLEHSPAVAA